MEILRFSHNAIAKYDNDKERLLYYYFEIASETQFLRGGDPCAYARSFDITRVDGIYGHPWFTRVCLVENKHAILVCIYSAGFEAGRATSNIHRKSRQALFKRATKQTK